MKQTEVVNIQLLNEDAFPHQKKKSLSVVGEDGTLSPQGGREIRAMPQLQNLESMTIRDKQAVGRTVTRICLCLRSLFNNRLMSLLQPHRMMGSRINFHGNGISPLSHDQHSFRED